MFKKMNNKGYMLIEIILAFALAFAIMYFMMDMVIKLKNKNDDLLVKTLIYSDQAIVSNKIMEHLIDDTDGGTTNNFSCDKISVDGQAVKYNDEVIFPDKVKINLKYLDNWSFFEDIKIIIHTVLSKDYE